MTPCACCLLILQVLRVCPPTACLMTHNPQEHCKPMRSSTVALRQSSCSSLLLRCPMFKDWRKATPTCRHVLHVSFKKDPGLSRLFIRCSGVHYVQCGSVISSCPVPTSHVSSIWSDTANGGKEQGTPLRLPRSVSFLLAFQVGTNKAGQIVPGRPR